jgi:hypothetical protein
VSDSMANRSFSGDSEMSWETRESVNCVPGRRRLVEECETISIYAIQQAFGKKPLIAAIRQARPFPLQVTGGHFEVWLVDESHRLPGRFERWSSDSTARLWFICSACKHRVAKLFYFLLPGSATLSDLLCRRCHGLTYLCVNSGGNRWYRQIARPLKRRLREKSKLLGRRQTPRTVARLVEIEAEIRRLKHRVKPRTQRQTASQRRPYRNLDLVG